MTTSRENRVGYQIEHRIVRRDKSVRWIATRGRTFVDKLGRAERMIGVVADVTDRHMPGPPQVQRLGGHIRGLKQANIQI